MRFQKGQAIIACVLLSLGIYLPAKAFELKWDYKTYDQAYTAPSYIHFDMTSHHFGHLVSSKIEGTAKVFRLQCQYESMQKSFSNCHMVVESHALDLDSGFGNPLLRSAIDSQHHPQIPIHTTGHVMPHTQSIPLEIQLKGVTKTVPTALTMSETAKEFIILGSAENTLSAFGIPKLKFPGMGGLMALDDSVLIHYRLVIPKRLVE